MSWISLSMPILNMAELYEFNAHSIQTPVDDPHRPSYSSWPNSPMFSWFTLPTTSRSSIVFVVCKPYELVTSTMKPGD